MNIKINDNIAFHKVGFILFYYFLLDEYETQKKSKG